MINRENNAVPEVNLVIPQTVTSAEAFATSLTMNREQLSLSPAENKTAVNLPPMSITTVVINY